MGFRAALIFAKADWAELVHTFGYPSWGTLEHPCPLCQCPSEFLLRQDGYDALSWPWPDKSWEPYNRACNMCEIKRTFTTDAQLRKVRATLSYDRRKDGNRGRCLDADMPEFGLLKGDRVEPSATMPDCCEGLDSSTAPATLIFWRRSNEGMTRHRNPVFGPETGVDPYMVLAIDGLHCCSLGVHQHYLGFLLWQLVAVNAWRVEGPMDVRLQQSIDLCREDLFAWYASEELEGRRHTKVQNFTKSMIGPQHAPILKLHGAETNGFLRFSLVLIAKFQVVLPNLRDHELAAKALVDCLDLIRKYPHRFPPAANQRFVHNTKVHIKAIVRLGMDAKPKHHQFLHMGHRIAFQGSPALWAAWVDESLNNIVKKIAAKAHRQVWAARCLVNFNQQKNRGGGGAKRQRE